MKREGYLMERIADPDNLRLAFWKARKGKNYNDEVKHYRFRLDANLAELRPGATCWRRARGRLPLFPHL